MRSVKTIFAGVRPVGNQIGLLVATLPIVPGKQFRAVQPHRVIRLGVKKGKGGDHLACAHGKVAAAVPVAVPIHFTRRLVDHVPLPDGLDLSTDCLRIHFPQQWPVDSLDVNLVMVARMPRHHIAVCVVMTMPAPPEEAFVIDEFRHGVVGRLAGELPVAIVAADA